MKIYLIHYHYRIFVYNTYIISQSICKHALYEQSICEEETYAYHMPHMMCNKGVKQPELILTLIICNLEQSIHIYFGNSLRLCRHVLLLFFQMVLIVNRFENHQV